jgi:hypothetical protein
MEAAHMHEVHVMSWHACLQLEFSHTLSPSLIASLLVSKTTGSPNSRLLSGSLTINNTAKQPYQMQLLHHNQPRNKGIALTPRRIAFPRLPLPLTCQTASKL